MAPSAMRTTAAHALRRASVKGKGTHHQHTSSSASLSLPTPAVSPGSCGSCRTISTSTTAAAASTHLRTQPSSSSSQRAPSSSSSSALVRPVRIVPPRPLIAIKKTKASRSPAGQSSVPSGPTPEQLREHYLAKLYALHAAPSVASLNALAERISPDLLGSKSSIDPAQLAGLIEQCCTCSTFWTVVNEHEESLRLGTSSSSSPASSSPSSPAGFEGASASSSSSTTNRYTNFLDATRDHNDGLSVLGNHLLGVFALEWLEARYPHLPERVMKAALTLYVGPRTCSEVASRQWGITSGEAAKSAFLPGSSDSSAILQRVKKSGQPLRGVGEGGRSGAGLLRWGRPESTSSALSSIESSSSGLSPTSPSHGSDDKAYKTPLPLETALASAARAIVGLIFQEHGFAATRSFVHSVFLSRSADIEGLLKFSNPKATLSQTLKKYGRGRAVSRLLGESGRLSIAPIFVTGVFAEPEQPGPATSQGSENTSNSSQQQQHPSFSIKLGEGFGSSLKMSEYRAAEDALRRIYLSPLVGDPVRSMSYSAAPASSSSSLELPTDTLVYPGQRRLSRQRQLPDDEILFQSSGRSSAVSSS